MAIVAAAVGVIVAVLPRDDHGAAITTKPPATATTATTATAAASDPAWLGAAPGGAAVVTSPSPGARVDRCVTVAGEASRLAGDRTVVVGFRRDDSYAGTPYRLYRIADPDNPASAAHWSAQVPLGGVADQQFDLVVLSADRDAVRALWQQPGRDPLTTDATMRGLELKLEARLTVELGHPDDNC